MKKKETFSPLFSSAKSGSLSFSVRASKATTTQNVSGVVFEPFEEVKKELDLLPNSPQISLARHMYSPECEAAVNEQINVEYNASYVYHALYAYFDRDNVALKGLAKFFKDSSVQEREHAEKLMEYQNKRGGRVKLQPMVMPLTEFDYSEKGDALYAMELTLSLEKLVNEKLLKVHSVASKNDDVQLADFIESEFLNEQVEAIKKISEYVSEYLDYVQAVAGFMTEVTKNSVSFDPSQLALTSDAASAIEIISFCLADSGNAFLVPTPYSPGVVER